MAVNSSRDDRSRGHERDKEKGPPPWGDGFAIIEGGREAEDGPVSAWVNLGPVWENKDGSLQLRLEVEPIAWRDLKCKRVIQIRRRPERS